MATGQAHFSAARRRSRGPQSLLMLLKRKNGLPARLHALMLSSICEIAHAMVRAMTGALGGGAVALRFGCGAFEVDYFVGVLADLRRAVASNGLPVDIGDGCAVTNVLGRSVDFQACIKAS